DAEHRAAFEDMSAKEIKEWERNIVRCVFCRKKLTTENVGPWLTDLDRRCCMKCYRTKVNKKPGKLVPILTLPIPKIEPEITRKGRCWNVKSVKVTMGKPIRHK